MYAARQIQDFARTEYRMPLLRSRSGFKVVDELAQADVAMTTKAWLEGDLHDLQVLAQLLTDGDTRVVHDSDEGAYYLTAPEIDGPPGGKHFYDVATELIAHLNGIGGLADPGFQPVTLSGKYTDGESQHQVISVPSIEFRLRMGMPTVTVTRPDGTVVPGPPSRWGTRLALAKSNPDVAEVLKLLNHSESLTWVDLYKVHEIIRHSIKPRKISDLGWADKSTDSSFTGSANLPAVSGAAARHARMEGNPTRTMTLTEGRSYISRLVTKWLDSLNAL